MIDSHCHLDFSAFQQDLSKVLNRSKEAGITEILIPGVEKQQWLNFSKFKEQVDAWRFESKQDIKLHFTAGLHPYFFLSEWRRDLTLLEELVTQDWIWGVGECGIDSALAKQNLDATLAVQRNLFESQLAIANQVRKPIVVHHRQSHHLILQSFKQQSPQHGGIIHAFSGSLQDAERYIDFGFKLGCGGTITYPRASKTRNVFKEIGLQHIVLETDAPDMPINGRQGQRNEPAFVKAVAQELAELKQIDLNEVVKQTTKNFYSLTM